MSKATLNRGTQFVAERAKAAGLPLAPFSVHDLRRTCVVLLVDRLVHRAEVVAIEGESYRVKHANGPSIAQRNAARHVRLPEQHAPPENPYPHHIDDPF